MSEIENSLLQTLEQHPEDWSVRFLVVDKMMERGALGEASDLVLSSPVPPDSDFHLQRVAEVGGVGAVSMVKAYVGSHPANGYAHEVLATLLEGAGDLAKAEEHRAVAMALNASVGPSAGGGAASGASIPGGGFNIGSPAPGPVHETSTVAEEEAYALPDNLLPTPDGVGVMEEQPADFLEYETPDEPPKQRGAKVTAVMVAIAVHLLIALIAMLVVILPPAKDEPEIVAAVIGPPKKKQEMQKKNVVKQTKKTSASSAAAAPLAQLMRANAMAKISLPNVTRTSKGPLGIGDADFGGGGFGSGGQGLGSGASFFGGTSTGQRFLFVLDHSGSMKKNQVELRNDELEKALKSLKGVQYQVLLFAGGAYYASKGWSIKAGPGRSNIATGPKGTYDFKMVGGAGNYDFAGKKEDLPKAEWLSSTSSNVKKTMEIVKRDRLFFGTDWGLALDIAHYMDPPPDVIFFMADGTGGNTPGPILQVNSKNGKPPINMVAMQTTAGINQFAEIAKKTKGSFTIVDKKGKPIDGFDYMKDPSKFKGRL